MPAVFRYRLRPDQTQLLLAYLVFLLVSPLARAAIETSTGGASASIVNISQATIRNFVVPLPPVAEQQRTIDHLDAQVAQIDALIERIRGSIALMRQYRSALITTAVTGKIDVRDPA